MGDVLKFRRVRKQKQKPKSLRPNRRAKFRPDLRRLCGFALALTVLGGIGVYQTLVGQPVTEIAQAANIVAVAPFTQVVETANSSRQVSRTFRRCGSSRSTCVVDGDTLWLDGVKIRIGDIDTPEVSQPRCASEKALGDRATKRLIELVNAGDFEVQYFGGRDEDRYGRKLRVLTRDGRSIGDILVSEGLARTWTGRRQPWC